MECKIDEDQPDLGEGGPESVAQRSEGKRFAAWALGVVLDCGRVGEECQSSSPPEIGVWGLSCRVWSLWFGVWGFCRRHLTGLPLLVRQPHRLVHVRVPRLQLVPPQLQDERRL